VRFVQPEIFQPADRKQPFRTPREMLNKIEFIAAPAFEVRKLLRDLTWTRH
jgi:hypothetical protein